MKKNILFLFAILFSIQVNAQIFNLSTTSTLSVNSCSDNNTYQYKFTPVIGSGTFNTSFNLYVNFSFLDGNGGPWQPVLCSACSSITSFPVNLSVSSVINGTASTVSMSGSQATIPITNYSIGQELTVNFNLKLDCSVSTSNPGVGLNLIESWTANSNISISGGPFSKGISFLTVNVDPLQQTVFTGSYQQDLVLLFKYKFTNNGSSNVSVSYVFNNPELINCFPSQTNIIMEYRYNNGAWTQTISPLTVSNNPNGEFLEIKQTIEDVAVCLDNCANKFATLNWKCNNGPSGFCNQCNVINTGNSCAINYSLNTKQYSGLDLKRISPIPAYDYTDLSRNDISCPNTELQWEYVVENTSADIFKSVEITLCDGINFDFYYGNQLGQNLSFNESGNFKRQLSIISKSTISYEIENCPSCSTQIRHDDYSVVHPFPDGYRDESFNLTPACFFTDAIKSFRIVVSDLAPGQKVHFRFKTFRCCSADPDLYNVIKTFNNWFFQAKVRSECDDSFVATSNPNNVSPLNGSGGWPGYISSQGTIYPDHTDYVANMNTQFSPSVVQIVGPHENDPPAIVPFFVEMTGFAIGNADFLGITQNNPNTLHGFLRAKIHCDQGLKAANLSTVNFTNLLGNLTWNQAACYSPIEPLPLENSCIAADYYVYFNLSDPNAVNILNSGKFNFSLSPCCLDYTATLKNYSVSFDLLMSPDASCPQLGVNPNSTGSCLSMPACNNCCWLPMRKEEGDIILTCPGCKAPGVITLGYKLERKFYGLPDIDDNGVPESVTPFTPYDIIPYTPYADGLVRKNYSNKGDILEDKLTAYLTPGDQTLGGYTYEGDMLPNAQLNFLQLARYIPLGKQMDLTIQEFTLYIDTPDVGICLDCEQFGYAPGSLTTLAKIHIDQPGLISLFVTPSDNGPDRSFQFAFDLNGINSINNYNDPSLSDYLGVHTFHKFRLKVTYKECGNFIPPYPATFDDIVRKSVITNDMWLSGAILTQGAPQMPQSASGVTFDSQFANTHRFVCETFNGVHYFLPIGTQTNGSVQGNSDNQCQRTLETVAYSAIAIGNNLYRYEYKPSPLSADQLNVVVPPNWTISGLSSSSVYVNRNPYQVATSVFTPVTPLPALNNGVMTIDFSSLAPLQCIDNNAFPASTVQYAGDEVNYQIFRFVFEPANPSGYCNTSINTSIYCTNTPTDPNNIKSKVHQPACLGNNTDCSNSPDIVPFINCARPLEYFQPNPHLTFGFPSNTEFPFQNSNSTCIQVHIENLSVLNLNYTAVSNLFIAIPHNIHINSWTSLSPCSANPVNVFSSFRNNILYDVIPIGNLALNGECLLNLCANYNDCPFNISFNMFFGWNCTELTSNMDLNAVCHFEMMPSPNLFKISTLERILIFDKINASPSYALCQPFSIDYKLQSLDGAFIPEKISFSSIPNNLSIQYCELIDCQNSSILSPPLNQVAGTNDYEFPAGISLSTGATACIRVWYYGTCGYAGQMPGIKITGSSFCNSPWETQTLQLLPIAFGGVNHCNCNNCSNLTLTYETSHCYVTFTAGGFVNSSCDSTSYFWTFGDGDTLTSGDTVSHEYGFNGNYTVSYIQYCFDSLGVLMDSCVVDTTIAVQCEGCNGLYMETEINGCEVSMQAFAPNLVGCDFVMFAWGYGDGTYTPMYSLDSTSTHTYPQGDTTYLLCFGAFCYSDGQLVNECKLCKEIQISCNNNPCEGLKINVDNIKNCSVTFSAVLPQGLNCANPVFVWYFEGSPVTGSQVQNHVFSGAGTYTVYCEVYCNGAVPGVDPPTCKGNTTVKTENCTCDDFKITSETQNCSVTFHALVPSNYSCSNPVYVWYFDSEPPVTGTQTQVHQFSGSGYHTIWCEVYCNGSVTGSPDCKVADYIILEDCHIPECVLLEDGLTSSEKVNVGRDILKTSDNGYIIVGDLNQAYSDKDLYAVKYDQYENVEFKLRYGDSGNNTYVEAAYSVAETNDAFYIAGAATVSSTGNSDAVVTKVLKNPMGTISWSKRYDFGRDDVARKIIDVGSGQLLVAGYTNSGTTAPASDYDMLAFTIDAAGNVVSKNIYGNRQSSKLEFAYDAIKLSGANQVILAGEARVPGGKDILLVKIILNSSLSFSSNKILKGNGNELANSLVEYNGYLWVTGFSNSWSSTENDTDIFVAKISPSDFSVQGFQMYGSTTADEAGNKIRKTSDGNLIVAGWRRNTSQKYDGLELKVQTSALANNYWSKITSYSNNSNLFYSVDEFLTDRYLLTGNYFVSAQNTELLKVLTDNQAFNCCLTNYSLSTYAVTPTVGSTFTAQAIGPAAVDSSNLISTFISENILCASGNTRAENTIQEDLNQHSGIIVFPNPANNTFKIQLDNKEEIIRQIQLYDISGRIVKSIPNPVRKDGVNFEVDSGRLIDGLYFIEVTGESQSWKTKVIINK